MILPTIILILLLVGIYSLPYIFDFGEGSESSFYSFIEKWWKDNEEIRNGEWYRLLTANFLHADVLHLLSNIYGLYIFGSGLPTTLMLVLFVVGGIVGNIFSFLFNPSPSLGASSGVFAMVGFILAVLFTGGIGAGLDGLILYIVISFVYASIPGSRIDIFGHLGGLIAGIIIGILL